MKKYDENKKYTALRKLTENRFLNLYEMDAIASSGAPFHYYFASRNEEENLWLKTKDLKSNGIVIYPICEEYPDRIVMIKQYRYPIDTWLYELPAGLVDEGETASQAAIREMKEETGMDFVVYEGGKSSFRRPFFLGAGMTDETSTTIFGYAKGEISKEWQEDSERIQVILVNQEEAKRILEEERVSLRAAFLLMHFLRSDGKSPFEFLE